MSAKPMTMEIRKPIDQTPVVVPREQAVRFSFPYSRWLLLTLFWLCGQDLSAQALEVLLDQVREVNPELSALQQESRAAELVAPQVAVLPDPELGIGVFALPVETRLGAQRFRISASQMFPWFGSLEAKEGVAHIRAQVAREEVNRRQLELIYQLKAAYFRLYEIRRSQEVLRRNILLLQRLRQLGLSRVKSGRGGSAEVLRTELRINDLQQELVILKNSEEQPLAELNGILGRPLDSPVSFPDSFGLAILPFQKDSLLISSAAEHPTIRRYTLQQELSRKNLLVNQKSAGPSFGLGLDYIWVDPRSDADPIRNGRDILQLNARLSLPLFRKKYAAREEEERLRIAAYEHRIADAENRFSVDIEKAYASWDNARLRLELYEQQLSTLSRVIRLMEAEYRTGGSGFDELLGLEMERVTYDLKKLKAVVESQLAKAALEKYLIY